MSNRSPSCISEKEMSNIYHICDKLFDSIHFVSFYIYLAIHGDCVSCPEQNLFGHETWLGTQEPANPRFLSLDSYILSRM